jgi:outer membrane biosynthesis protein TonB
VSESEGREQQKPSRAVPKKSDLPDILAGENIDALTDRLFDALIGDDPAPSPETASAEAPAAPESSPAPPIATVREATSVPTASTAEARPLVHPGIELDGDHGEDIEDRLQSLFGDEPSPAPVTPRADPVAEIVQAQEPDPPVVAAPPAPFEPPKIDEPAPAAEAELDVFRAEAPAAPMEEVEAVSPAPTGQIATIAQQPAIPWSQTTAKSRGESLGRSGFKTKWLAAALLVGGLAALAWFVLSPGSGPIENTTVTRVASTSRRTSPPATTPVEKLAALIEPDPEVPTETIGGAAEAPAKPVEPAAEKPTRVKPPPQAAKTRPPITAKAPEKASTKPVEAAAEKPTRVKPPPPKTATDLVFESPRRVAKPAPPSEPPLTIASNDAVTKEPPSARVIEPAASPPAPVVRPTQPELISRPAPSHRKRDGTGVIVLKVLVSQTGRVSRVVIQEGIPGSPLEASAIDAALRSTYRPATEDGQPASAWTVERLEFE